MKTFICVAMRGRYETIHGKEKVIQKLEANQQEIINSLTTIWKDNLVLEIYEDIQDNQV